MATIDIWTLNVTAVDLNKDGTVPSLYLSLKYAYESKDLHFLVRHENGEVTGMKVYESYSKASAAKKRGGADMEVDDHVDLGDYAKQDDRILNSLAFKVEKGHLKANITVHSYITKEVENDDGGKMTKSKVKDGKKTTPYSKIIPLDDELWECELPEKIERNGVRVHVHVEKEGRAQDVEVDRRMGRAF